MKSKTKLPPTPAQSAIARFKQDAAKLRKVIAWIQAHEKQFDQLEGITPGFYSGQIDFDRLPHKSVIKVVRVFGGKWTKTAQEDAKINYETDIDGMRLRCWQGEPPPNCRIVQEEVLVPAHTEYRNKLVCTSSARVANAQ